MTPETFAEAVVAPAFIGWLAINVVCWRLYMPDEPWNWRVLVGARVYFRWLMRREAPR